MLLIPCPYCGERPELEFRYGGEAHVARPSGNDDEVARSLYLRENKRGIHAERWRHIHGCGRFFNCVRDTVSDRIIGVYKSGEAQPELPAEGKA